MAAWDPRLGKENVEECITEKGYEILKVWIEHEIYVVCEGDDCDFLIYSFHQGNQYAIERVRARLQREGQYVKEFVCKVRGRYRFMIVARVPGVSLEEELFKAIREEDVDTIRKLGEEGLNILNISEEFDRYELEAPLTLAIRKQSSCEVIQALVEMGANPNETAVVEEFPKNSLLYIALHNPTLDQARCLLELGANPDIYIMDEDGVGQYLLVEAIGWGDLNVVELLLEHGADVNVGDGNVIDAAIYSANLNIIHLLLKYGLDINEATYHGTPLEVAVKYKNPIILKYLLDEGALLPTPLLRKLLKENRDPEIRNILEPVLKARQLTLAGAAWKVVREQEIPIEEEGEPLIPPILPRIYDVQMGYKGYQK